jgi:hypothetical protein
VEGNLEGALSEEARTGAVRKLSGKEEALLVATACSKAPVGCARWTLKLLAGRMVELTEHAQLARATIRRRLHEKELKPWQRKMWCIAKVDGEYIARMEDVLDLYAEQPDPKHPVVSFDESPQQLIGEVREPTAAAPGRVPRYDSQYKRNGTANLFVMLDVHRPWRHVKVTDHRSGEDFAECMRDLVDRHYPQAEKIRVVLDNLSTHSAAALYNHFAPQEARRIMRKIEFHYTPKHASWLNMVEIEIGVMRTQCLDRRIASGRNWNLRLPCGNDGATSPETKLPGCSTVREPARSWLTLMRNSAPNSDDLQAAARTGRNHCAEALALHGVQKPGYDGPGAP